MKKKIISILSIFILISTSGCIDYQKLNQMIIKDEQEEQVAVSQLYKTDVYTYGYYGDKNQEYDYDLGYDMVNILGERIAASNEEEKYIKLNESIYSVDNGNLEEVYTHNKNIQSIIGCNDEIIAFVAYDNNDNKREINLYNIELGQVERTVPIGGWNVLDDEYLITSSSGRKLVFYSDEEDYHYDIGSTEEGSIPEGYEIAYEEKGFPIVYRKEDWVDLELTDYISLSGESYDKGGICPSRCRMSQVDDIVIAIMCVDINDNYYPAAPRISSPEHCDTDVWEFDILHLYDGANGNELYSYYKDTENRILGYNYDENKVYLYSYENNEIVSKILDSEQTTTIRELEEAEKIKFSWCDTTLFWIYENDGIETYGGYLVL